MDPLLAKLFLEGAALVLKEIRLGRYDHLPDEERRKIKDAAAALETEWASLAPRDGNDTG